MTSRDVIRVLRDPEVSSREEALARIAPLVYEQLRLLAAAQLRKERVDHTLQPTALVNEAYLRLARSKGDAWADRGHFFRVASEAMRHILVDHARGRARQKRGGGLVRVTLEQVPSPSWQEPERLLALDKGLTDLAAHDPRAAEVVQLRYFGGLSVRETAKTLELSERTVKREWAFARAWLLDELREDDD